MVNFYLFNEAIAGQIFSLKKMQFIYSQTLFACRDRKKLNTVFVAEVAFATNHVHTAFTLERQGILPAMSGRAMPRKGGDHGVWCCTASSQRHLKNAQWVTIMLVTYFFCRLFHYTFTGWPIFLHWTKARS